MGPNGPIYLIRSLLIGILIGIYRKLYKFIGNYSEILGLYWALCPAKANVTIQFPGSMLPTCLDQPGKQQKS